MSWGPRDDAYTAFPPSVRIAPPVRRGLRFSREEYGHILLACGALIAAFTISFVSPLYGPLPPNQSILRIVIGATVAVLTGFFLHELAHKVVAQGYGAWAEFRSSRTGLIMAIFTAFLGIVFAAPGAVYIAGPLTREQNGRVSLVGPMTNFVIALLFTGAWFGFQGFPTGNIRVYVGGILYFSAYINAFLGVFNMLPIPPLDGSKVFRWNVAIWAVAIVGMGGLLAPYFLGYIR